MRNYAAVDGLPQSQVTSLVEDDNGYLWIGTQAGGLARFDGSEFKVYTTRDGLLMNEIWGLLKDKKEHIWILHANGVTRYDGRHFKKFPFPQNSNTRINRIYQQGDSIFLFSRSSGTLSRVYNDSLYYSAKPIIPGKMVRQLHLAPTGEACFFTSDEIVIQSETKKFSIALRPEIGKLFNVFNWKGRVLMRTAVGCFSLNIKDKRIEKFFPEFQIKNYVAFYDHKRDVFWTTNGSSFFKETSRKNTYKIDTIFQDVGIGQVLIDSEDNTWFASDGHGLFKYFIQDFDRVDTGKPQCIMGVLKDDTGCMWLATIAKGLRKIDKGKITHYSNPENMSRNSMHSLKQAPDGNIWAGSEFGIGKYDSNKDYFDWITMSDKGLPGNKVLGIDFDDQRGMWVATFNGVGYYKDERWVKRYRTEDGLKSNMVWSIYYSKKYKTLFVGTNVGLQKISNEKVSTVSLKQLENSCVLSINTFRDSLLALGTAGGGLIFLNPRSETHQRITTQDGLASDFIYFVTSDEKDYIWVGTEKGINRIKFNTNFEITENLHYGYDNGLLGVETNHNAYYFTKDGKYFGLVDGVYRFNDVDGKRTSPFKLHLTDIEILYGEHSVRDYADSVFSFFKIPYKVSLPPDRNHVTFYFNRVDKRYPKSVKFKYFLENFDKAWSPPSSSKQVTYGNLPPGEYVFRVMATNNEGSWSDDKIAYAFTVLSPFYFRASFIVGVVILIIGLVTLILYIRVKQRIRKVVVLERIRIKEQESLRKEIARDFHDEMGNQLTRIINYVSQLKLNGKSGLNREELYTKVEDSAKYLYSGTRDFIWSIDPINDELIKLFIHIRDFGEKLFEEKNINFRAFNNVKERIKLPYGFSREANLIFKEAMTNAFKYSEAKNVSLSLSQNDTEFEIILEDDGKGFYFGTIEKSNGLKNIRERADKINGVLRISSEASKGTKISLHFKIAKTLNYGITI